MPNEENKFKHHQNLQFIINRATLQKRNIQVNKNNFLCEEQPVGKYYNERHDKKNIKMSSETYRNYIEN